MSKTLTITRSDDQYEAARFAAPPSASSMPDTRAAPAPFVDAVLAVMRANGHLVDPATMSPHPRDTELPARQPRGSAPSSSDR